MNSNHILRGSRDLVSRLQQVEAEPEDFLVKIGVKDLYMSGEPRHIVNDTIKGFKEGAQNKIQKDSLWFLLSNQYITSSIFPDRLWRIMYGSGQGLPQSGDTTDVSLCNKADKNVGP